MSEQEHVAIVAPDDSKRFRLGRFITREPTTGWKVFVAEDGRTVTLKAVLQ